MKYLKKFNELKSQTFSKAAGILKSRGHHKRATQLKDYSDLIKYREDLAKVLEKDSNNPFLQDPDNKLEGFAYLYNGEKKVWQKIGLTSVQIEGVWLNTDDCYLDYLEFPDFEARFYVSLRINLENLEIDPKYYHKKDLKWNNQSLELTMGANLLTSTNWGVEFSYIDDTPIVILLTRKGLRNMNKILRKYLTDGYGQKVKWHGKSEGQFLDSELYSVPDYLYNLLDLQLSIWQKKATDEQKLKLAEFEQNFDDNFRDWMKKMKAPKVYYRIYRDDFPAELKNIGLE